MKPYRLDYLNDTYLKRLENQLSVTIALAPKENPSYPFFLHHLRSPETRRVLFDSVQAQRFAPALEFPTNFNDHVHPPFKRFYMEFNEPVFLPSIYGVDSTDGMRAMMFLDLNEDRLPVIVPGELTGGKLVTEDRRSAHLSYYFHDPGGPSGGWHTDRNMRVDLKTGAAFVSPWMATRKRESRFTTIHADANTVNLRQEHEDPELVEGLRSIGIDLGELGRHGKAEKVAFEAGIFADRRPIGWWEEQALVFSSLLRWCLVYMMAKSIIIQKTEVPMSRQQRRWHNRKGIPLPQPWHVVQVDPRYVPADPEGHGEGREHGYRYDVIGHPRLGRHRRKNERGEWEWFEKLEWVPPHQRGLKHALYVPKTYSVDERRKVLPELKRPEVADVQA